MASKSISGKNEQRDLMICNESKAGKTMVALAIKYGLSSARIAAIIKHSEYNKYKEEDFFRNIPHNLKTRCYCALKNAGIDATREDDLKKLAAMPAKALLKTTNMGMKSLYAIADALEENGYIDDAGLWSIVRTRPLRKCPACGHEW